MFLFYEPNQPTTDKTTTKQQQYRKYRYYSRDADIAYTGSTSTSHTLSNLYSGVVGGGNTGGTNNVNYCNEHCKANLLDELAVDEKARSKKITKKYT